MAGGEMEREEGDPREEPEIRRRKHQREAAAGDDHGEERRETNGGIGPRPPGGVGPGHAPAPRLRSRLSEPRSAARYSLRPWHFLYFLPLPHGHGSFRPTFAARTCT